MILDPIVVWPSRTSTVIVMSPNISLIEIRLGEHWKAHIYLPPSSFGPIIPQLRHGLQSPFQMKDFSLLCLETSGGSENSLIDSCFISKLEL